MDHGPAECLDYVYVWAAKGEPLCRPGPAATHISAHGSGRWEAAAATAARTAAQLLWPC